MPKLINVKSLSQDRCSHPIAVCLKYATHQNFVGRPLVGYDPEAVDCAFMTESAAEALCKVQNDLSKRGLGVCVYDAYRPRKTVAFFSDWTKSREPPSPEELERKKLQYPQTERSELFSLGYLAEDSGHCYGDTVDVFLVDADGQELPMGACYDYMDPTSRLDTPADKIGDEAYKNRQMLCTTMEQNGFKSYITEFWHYRYKVHELENPVDVDIVRGPSLEIGGGKN